MAEMYCPECRAAIEAAAGATACPRCGAALASSGGITADPPRSRDAGIAEGSPRRADERRGSRFDDDIDDLDLGSSRWANALTGLKLLWWATVIGLVLVEALAGFLTAMPFDPAQPPVAGPALGVSLGAGCGLLVVGILAIVGICLCCTSPDPTARSRAIWTIVLSVLSVGSGVVLGIVVGIMAVQDVQRQGGGPPQPMAPDRLMATVGWPFFAAILVQIAFALAASVAWMSFHSAVGAAFRNPAVGRLAMIVLAVWVVTMPVGMILANLPPEWLDLDPLAKVRLQSGVGLVLNLFSYGSYLVLCSRTISAIESGREGSTVEG